MQNDWNNSTESERVAELQHRCPDLYRDLAKLEHNHLPYSVQIALQGGTIPQRIYRTSFYECLSFRDKLLRTGRARWCGPVWGQGSSFYFDWSPNG